MFSILIDIPESFKKKLSSKFLVKGFLFALICFFCGGLYCAGIDNRLVINVDFKKDLCTFSELNGSSNTLISVIKVPCSAISIAEQGYSSHGEPYGHTGYPVNIYFKKNYSKESLSNMNNGESFRFSDHYTRKLVMLSLLDKNISSDSSNYYSAALTEALSNKTSNTYIKPYLGQRPFDFSVFIAQSLMFLAWPIYIFNLMKFFYSPKSKIVIDKDRQVLISKTKLFNTKCSEYSLYDFEKVIIEKNSSSFYFAIYKPKYYPVRISHSLPVYEVDNEAVKGEYMQYFNDLLDSLNQEIARVKDNSESNTITG